MSTGLEQIREKMAGYLNGHGVRAVAAWPGEPRKEPEEPVVVVSLRGCRAGSSGFQDYLGERFNAASGHWEERYGKRAELTFGLDVYAPEKGGGRAVQKTFDDLAGALILGAPEGMELREFSCGQTARDPERRLLRRPVEAVCAALLWAVEDAGGEFIDFELRGVVKQ